LEIVKEFKIPAASGIAVEVKKNQVFRPICPQGGQAGDVVAFNLNNLREKFSAGRTRIENGQRLRITTGDKLYSNALNVMFVIKDDTCGVHDLLWPECCKWVFENRYKCHIPGHNGCLENLANALKPWKLDQLDVPDPFNIFTYSFVDSTGRIRFDENKTPVRAYLDLKAEMDCVVALSACAAHAANPYGSGPNVGETKPLEAAVLQ
jgi:uncharacterized protein YcgI (DUF1989 family)